MVNEMNHVGCQKDKCEFRGGKSVNVMNVRNIQKLLGLNKILFFPYAVTYVACINTCSLLPTTTII